jgi:hypothetical protein
LSLWLKNQCNKGTVRESRHFKTFDFLMPKAKVSKPPAKMKPILINPQTGPFEKLIEQAQDAYHAQSDRSDPTGNQT